MRRAVQHKARGRAVMAGLLVAAVALTVEPATGGTLTTGLSPLADTYVDASVPGTNYGTSTKIKVDTSPDVHTYLRFDLTALTGTVTRAILTVTPTSSLSAGLDVRTVADDTWTERGMTYTNAPALGPVGATSGPGTTGIPLNIDVTSIVIDGGDVNLALTGRSTTASSLASRESTTPPSLVVDTTTSTTPSNTAPPTVSGTPAVGNNLVAGTGTWDGAAYITYAYQWRRCDSSGANCVDRVGETAAAYKVINADIGSTLRVVVTATNSYGSAVASSAASAVVPTPPPPVGDRVVMAAGDIACGTASTGSACIQQQTSDLLVNGNPDAVLALGDDQYECGDPSDFQNSYAPSWGRVLAKTYPVPGNHEYAQSTVANSSCYNRPSGAPGYYGYFGNRSTPLQPGCTVSCNGYYSFDVGDWHLIALNSNCSKVGGCNVGNPQYTWLKSDLAAHPNQCTLAYYHHPRWTSGQELDTTAMGPIVQALYDARADLVLNGHDHDYERFAPLSPTGAVDPARGVREFIVGTGGRNTSTMITVKSGSEVRDSSTFGVLKLTLHPSGYDWQLVPVAGSTSGFNDSGSQPCHRVSADDVTAPTAPTSLVGSPAASDRADLSWFAASDDVGVVAYRVYRDGSLLTTIGNVLGYADSGAGAGTTHTYAVAAVDASGNESLPTAGVSVTTAPAPVSPNLLVDGFETGGFTQWNTLLGLTVQNATVDRGLFAGRSAPTSGASSTALKYFPTTATEVWASQRVRLTSQSTALTFGRLRSATGSAMASVGISPRGLLTYTNEVAATTQTSAVTFTPGVWHTVVLHAATSPGKLEVYLDGTLVAGLSRSESLGSAPFARYNSGDPSTSHVGDFFVDDVTVGTAPPA